jgi:hypothetical protein
MRGMNSADQYLTLYSPTKKTAKWPKEVFFFLSAALHIIQFLPAVSEVSQEVRMEHLDIMKIILCTSLLESERT